MNNPVYKILEWINIDNIEWDVLSENKNAIELLKQNKNRINWNNLSHNINAIELLKKNHRLRRKLIGVICL